MDKNKIICWIVIAVLLVIVILLMFARPKVATGNISNFNGCVKAGYPVMESNPRQCKTPDGKNFIEETSNGNCKNLCGDGTCQEIVCMAIGCPCVENKSSCLQDCNK